MTLAGTAWLALYQWTRDDLDVEFGVTQRCASFRMDVLELSERGWAVQEIERFLVDGTSSNPDVQAETCDTVANIIARMPER